MTNNDIFRQLRFILNKNDQQMQKVFQAAEVDVPEEQIKEWLIKDENKQLPLEDKDLSYFLDGLINLNRGKRADYKPVENNDLTNNEILQKLKIAFSLKDSDILELYQSVGVSISKHEITAFLRNPKQAQYREMGGQYLRNLLHALQLKYRPIQS